MRLRKIKFHLGARQHPQSGFPFMTSTAKDIFKLVRISTPYDQQRVIGGRYTCSIDLKILWGQNGKLFWTQRCDFYSSFEVRQNQAGTDDRMRRCMEGGLPKRRGPVKMGTKLHCCMR
jgi:hypothetical protein